MKKLSRLILFFSGLILLLSSNVMAATVTLGGVPVDGNLIISPVEGKYSITYTETSENELAADQQMVLLIVKGVSTTVGGLTISADNIRYIDQTSATTTSVTFSNFIPSSVPNCTILLGGFADGAKVIGYIAAVPVNIGGTMNFLSGSIQRAATVKLTENGNAANVYTVQTNTSGQFTVPLVTEGSYTLLATAESHASYTKTALNVTDLDLSGINGVLRPGELTGDININFSDLSNLLDDYNKTRTTALRVNADITGDNNINFSDLSSLLDSYNKSAISE